MDDRNKKKISEYFEVIRFPVKKRTFNTLPWRISILFSWQFSFESFLYSSLVKQRSKLYNSTFCKVSSIKRTFQVKMRPWKAHKNNFQSFLDQKENLWLIHNLTILILNESPKFTIIGNDAFKRNPFLISVITPIKSQFTSNELRNILLLIHNSNNKNDDNSNETSLFYHLGYGDFLNEVIVVAFGWMCPIVIGMLYMMWKAK